MSTSLLATLRLSLIVKASKAGNFFCSSSKDVVSQSQFNMCWSRNFDNIKLVCKIEKLLINLNNRHFLEKKKKYKQLMKDKK